MPDNEDSEFLDAYDSFDDPQLRADFLEAHGRTFEFIRNARRRREAARREAKNPGVTPDAPRVVPLVPRKSRNRRRPAPPRTRPRNRNSLRRPRVSRTSFRTRTVIIVIVQR
ncbi:hypothetical protein [Streptomyces liangshanensis]|uniref:Uncharacterized protein n=1 Tax=Streptomyces liangshanensis TaxID=2717324 RepID=A0A6G9H291_9ACTN|nr:hypothetical protein [Streptomyces liangshanensis]QIQ04653.1 hypothetical protein HA039_22295 [Streptomyces liangshanensis]